MKKIINLGVILFLFISMSISVYAYCNECEPLFNYSDNLDRIYVEYGEEYTIKTGDVLVYPLSESSNFEISFPNSEFEDCYLDSKTCTTEIVLKSKYFKANIVLIGEADNHHGGSINPNYIIDAYDIEFFEHFPTAEFKIIVNKNYNSDIILEKNKATKVIENQNFILGLTKCKFYAIDAYGDMLFSCDENGETKDYKERVQMYKEVCIGGYCMKISTFGYDNLPKTNPHNTYPSYSYIEFINLGQEKIEEPEIVLPVCGDSDEICPINCTYESDVDCEDPSESKEINLINSSAINTDLNNSINDSEEKDIEEELSLCNYIMDKAKISVGTKLPRVLTYKKEIFNIYTTKNEVVGHLNIEEGIVKEYECNLANKPTNNVYIGGKSTVDTILDSEKQIDELVKKINNDEVEIKGLTAGKKIKNFFAVLGLRIVIIFFLFLVLKKKFTNSISYYKNSLFNLNCF